MRSRRPAWNALLLAAFFLSSCTNDTVDLHSGYPKDMEKIFVTRCATTGCHNAKSKGAAGGIDLSTYQTLFEGGRNGTPVIAYNTEYSYLLYFVNTYPDIDSTILLPTMPYNLPPLSRDDVVAIRNWISAGAPDENGQVRFPEGGHRAKVYVANQACDQVAVFDADAKVIMRYVKVGIDDALTEAPHQIKLSPDGQYWYVVFYSSHVIQKFRTSDDGYVGAIDIGNGIWNTLTITADGSKGFAASLELNGKVAYIDLDNMQLITSYSGMEYPHGTWVSPDSHTLYVTAQYGNFIYKIDITDPFSPSTDYVVLQPGEPQSTSSSLDPHEIYFSPDGSRYFVTCQYSNEVRAFQASNDSLLAVIPVGAKPQEMSVSRSRPYLFVTCQEDNSQGPGKKGSVAVINYQTLQRVVPNGVYSGFQPHGLFVDDDRDVVYVANLNYDATGPAPHHVTDCGGRNGYLSIIRMSTLQLLTVENADGISYTYKNELLPFPYSVGFRP
jgi:DNA-binding beta-propeller fold protein YncE